MGGTSHSFAVLLQFIEDSIRDFPDSRKGKNAVYRIRDAALSAFSVFFMQSPSFLAHQKAMLMKKGKNNAQTVFNIHKIPADTHIRHLHDPIPPNLLSPLFDKIYSFLIEEGYIADLITYDGLLLIALDGTWFFSLGINQMRIVSDKKPQERHYYPLPQCH